MSVSADRQALQAQRELFLARVEGLEALLAERDRRYAEVAGARAEALQIKDHADRRALDLAREIQDYKDEANNRLREQINLERGLYATHGELGAALEKVGETLKPLAEFVSSQRGRSSGMNAGWLLLLQGVTLLGALIAIYFALHK